MKKTTVSLLTSLLSFSALHAKDLSSQNNKGTLNPPVQPYAKDGIGLFIQGELLFWKAHIEGLDYAVKTNYQDLPTTNLSSRTSGTVYNGTVYNGEFVSNFDGKVKNPQFNFNFGFGVTLGWNPNEDAWDTLLTWNHIHSTASDKVSANPNLGTIIIPEFQSFAFADQFLTYSSADSHWKLDYNTLDFEIGREYLVSRRLHLRPFIGVRAAWLQQRYTINSQGTDSAIIVTNGIGDFVATSGTIYSQSIMKNFYQGLGPRIGLGTDWMLGAGFSFYGEMGVALLLGHFKTDYEAYSDVFLNSLSGSSRAGLANRELTSQSSLTNSFRATRAATDLSLGLRWRHKFYDDQYSLCWQIGWDQQYFFDQNQFISFIDDERLIPILGGSINPRGVGTFGPFIGTQHLQQDSLKAATNKRGDLSLQGLNFTVRMDF